MSRQKINLNGEGAGDTIYVGDVDVKQGVYCKSEFYGDGFVHIVDDNGGIKLLPLKCGIDIYSTFTSLTQLVQTCSYKRDFYTLTGQRIVTEKELTVEDMNNYDIVGFVTNTFGKGHIIKVDGFFHGIYIHRAPTAPNVQLGGVKHLNIKDVFKYNDADSIVIEAFLFTGQNAVKELYAWLAED